MKVLFIILIIVLAFVLWQKWELTKFKVTTYKMNNPHISKEAKAVVIADLHGFTYGERNRKLIEAVRSSNPQVILIPGDMIVSKYSRTFSTALDLLAELIKIAPVYYAFGNHESRLMTPEKKNHPAFLQYLEQVRALGVQVMQTETRSISMGDDKIYLSALELELDYYEKGKILPMEPDYMNQHLGKPETRLFHILLAHNPAYAEEYMKWGADVTFCGHNHGGLVRIPGFGSLVSPQLTLFPKYDAGEFEWNHRRVIISRGMGTHTFHIRIFNRAELLQVHFLPEKHTGA